MPSEVIDAAEALGMDTRYEDAPTDSNWTHIVSPPENVEVFTMLMEAGNPDPSSQDIVDICRMNKWPVKALCGFEWVPVLNPEKYDVCQICLDVAGMHMRNAGE